MKVLFQISVDKHRWSKSIATNIDGYRKVYKAKRRYSLLLIYLAREVKLEYLSVKISHLAAYKIAVQRLFAMRQTKISELFAQNFLFCEIEIDIDINSLEEIQFEFTPLHVCEQWISRNAILGGIPSPDISRSIEYNLLRRKQLPRVLIWRTSRTPAIKNLALINNPVFTPRLLSSTYDGNRRNEVTVRNFKNVEVFGANCMLIDNKYVRLHAIEPLHDTCWPSEVPSRIQNSLYLPPHKSQYSLNKAIYVGHSQSWYHFIVEFLPYLDLIEYDSRAITLLIQKGAPSQIVELIKLLGFQNILEVGAQTSVLVKHLLTVVDFKRTSFADFSEDYGVQLDPIRRIVHRLFSFDDSLFQVRHRKVFLARNGDLLRGFTNQSEINDLLMKRGFELIYPENLSATEQAKLINESSHIVAESGAAITSLVFAMRNIVFLELRPPLGESRLFWKGFVESIGHKHFALDSKRLQRSHLSSNSRSYLDLEDLNSIISTIFTS